MGGSTSTQDLVSNGSASEAAVEGDERLVQDRDGRWCTERSSPVVDGGFSFGLDEDFVRFMAEEYNEPVFIDVAAARPPSDVLAGGWDYTLSDGSVVQLIDFGQFVAAGFTQVLGARYAPDWLIGNFFVPGPDGTWQYVTECSNDLFHTSVSDVVARAGLPGGQANQNAALLELLLPEAAQRATERLTGAELAALKAQVPTRPPASVPQAAADRRPDWSSLPPGERSMLDAGMPQELAAQIEVVLIDMSAIEFDDALTDEVLCFSTPTATDTCFGVGDVESDLYIAHRLPREPIFLDWQEWSPGDNNLKGPQRILTVPSSVRDGTLLIVTRDAAGTLTAEIAD